jgi:lysophospholipase L1-like esterase
VATPGTPSPADVGPRRLWLIAVLFGLVSSLVLATTVVLVTRSSEPAGVQPTERVVLLGDSITELSEPTLEARLGDRWALLVDGRSGATVAQRLPAAERAATDDPRQVVVNLGTNDVTLLLDPAGSVAQMRELLDLFPDATCLHVVTVGEGIEINGRRYDTEAAAFNEGLWSLAAADPRITVLDWDAALRAEETRGAAPDDLLHDTVHPTARGEEVLASLYASGLEACPAT